MKHRWVLLLALVPSVIGYISSATIMWWLAIPGIGECLYWLLPIAILVFWFWAGGKFADSGLGFVPAFLLAHWVGILSLTVYFWQFCFVDDSARSVVLAVFSQAFNSLTPLTAGLALYFEPEANTISRHAMTAVQVLGLLFMAVDFIIGYILRRWNNKRALV